MNRQMKRMMQRQGQLSPEGAPVAAPREPQQRQPTRAPGEKRTPPIQFFREVWTEMHKVKWPTRGEVANYSIIVLITLIVVIGMIFAIDFGLAKAAVFLFK